MAVFDGDGGFGAVDTDGGGTVVVVVCGDVVCVDTAVLVWLFSGSTYIPSSIPFFFHLIFSPFLALSEKGSFMKRTVEGTFPEAL